MIMPDVLIVENYRAIAKRSVCWTRSPPSPLPYLASAFGIFLLRQTFKSVPQELVEAARVEGAGPLGISWRVYVPLARPTYVAFGLVSVSYHWNNFLVAANRDELGRSAAAHRRPRGVRRAGDRGGLVGHHRGNRDDHGAAADRVPAVPTAVRSVLHARGYSLMRLLTWNIQCGKGCDGVTDLARIVAIARETMDADVFCFQEVSSNFAKHDGGGDQSAELAALLPGYMPIFRPAIETVDQAGHVASLRQHDPVAPAGHAGQQPHPAVAGRGERAQHAAPCAGGDGHGRLRRGAHRKYAS